MNFQIENLSKQYTVRKLTDTDVAAVYALCKENPLYYQYCPPFVTEDSIRADMAALPPRKTVEDKYYLGFYEGDRLMAVMDLILGFPKEETAFVGFFMVNKAAQGKGIGTMLMQEVYAYLKQCGFNFVRLGFAKGNPQSEHFWLKNGFKRTDVEAQNEGYVVVIMEKKLDNFDYKQVLGVLEKYSTALDLLDAYDHQNMQRPKGREAVYVLTYDECKQVISAMRFGSESELFGREKDDSFAGSIGNIYQSFAGTDVYPSLEEKAANLLYFVTKNHSFFDGNKRIAATMFLYFLDKNGVLFRNGQKLIDDHTLVALTIMIAESRPEEKEMMISVIMNCMK